jgi:hypothetical protein
MSGEELLRLAAAVERAASIRCRAIVQAQEQGLALPDAEGFKASWRRGRARVRKAAVIGTPAFLAQRGSTVARRR